MEKARSIMLLLACAGFPVAATTYYDWSGPAFAGDAAGVDRSPSGNPDGDRLANAEEYAYLTDPLATNASPFYIQTSNGILRIGFPWNSVADDLAWRLEHTPALVSNSWNKVSNLVVESSVAGEPGAVVVRPLDAPGSTGFFRLIPEVTEPELIVDALDDGLGWLAFNNAQFATSSSGLLPMVGTGFFKHSIGSNWSHSGMCKPTNIMLKEGRYAVSLAVGHDGSSRPFATGSVTLGFFDAASAIASAVNIRDAVNAFTALSGVSRVEAATPVPSNGWEMWRIEYVVAPGSAAIGKTVSFGIHAQSKGDGGTQAMFDGLSIAFVATNSIVVHAAADVATVNPLMFGVNLVYHKQVIDNNFSNAFEACGAELIRYPGGSICESDFDYLDSDGPDDDRPSLAQTIAFCKATGTELVLVVPTKRFVDTPAAGAQYAADFVRAVNVDKAFGDIQVTYWELGNEYYANPTGAPTVSAAQYAVVADLMAGAMVAVDPTIKPVVQFVRSKSGETQQIANYLAASTNAGSITACLTHTYPWTNNNFETTIRTEIPGQLATGRQIYGLDDLLITEWNIGADNAPTGMMLASYQLPLFEALLRGGASKTALWPLSWWNNGVKTVLSNYNTGALRPPGVLFSRLAQWTKNATLVQTDYTYAQCSVSAYRRGDAELTLFIVCRDLPTATLLHVAIEDFAFSSIQAERIGAADELSNNLPGSAPLEVQRAGNSIYLHGNAAQDWEVLRITLTQ